MKNLLNLLLLAVLSAVMLFCQTGCASVLYPKQAADFARNVNADELTITVATPWGTQSIQAKNLKTSVAVGEQASETAATSTAASLPPHASTLGTAVPGGAATPLPPEPPPISQAATPPVAAP